MIEELWWVGLPPSNLHLNDCRLVNKAVKKRVALNIQANTSWGSLFQVYILLYFWGPSTFAGGVWMCRVGNPKYPSYLICCMRIYLDPPFWITIHYHSTPKLVKKHHSEVFSSYYTYIIYGATTPVAITLTDLPFSPLHPCFPSQHSVTMAFSIWAKRLNEHHGHPWDHPLTNAPMATPAIVFRYTEETKRGTQRIHGTGIFTHIYYIYQWMRPFFHLMYR